MSMSDTRPIVVLGLGNPIMGDDGVGVLAVERLRDEWEVGEGVELVDGGTWGMTLLPTIEGARKLILVDAIHSGGMPGADVVLSGPRLPELLGPRLSVHQVDVIDLLTLARLRGTLPPDTVALGVEPRRIEMSTELTPAVAEGLARLPGRIAAQLQSWGATCRHRHVVHA